MTSHDLRIIVERYKHYNDGVVSYSFGCPQFGLMGYNDLKELFIDVYEEYNKTAHIFKCVGCELEYDDRYNARYKLDDLDCCEECFNQQKEFEEDWNKDDTK